MTTRRTTRRSANSDDEDESGTPRLTVDDYDNPRPVPEPEQTQEAPAPSSEFTFESGSNQRRRIVIGVFFVLLVAQVFVEGTEYEPYAPAEGLNIISARASSFFTETGKLFVVCGNAIARIVSLHSVAIAIYRLLEPVLETLFLSPLKFISGAFWEYLADVDLGVRGITTGAFVLLCVLVFAQCMFPEIVSPKNALVHGRKGVVAIYKWASLLLTDLFSVLYVLHLDKFMETLVELATPFFAILCVPFNAIKGMSRYVWDLRTNRIAALAGFIIIGGLFVYGAFWSGLAQWDVKTILDMSTKMGAQGRLTSVHLGAIAITFLPWMTLLRGFIGYEPEHSVVKTAKGPAVAVFVFLSLMLVNIIGSAVRLALEEPVTKK